MPEQLTIETRWAVVYPDKNITWDIAGNVFSHKWAADAFVSQQTGCEVVSIVTVPAADLRRLVARSVTAERLYRLDGCDSTADALAKALAPFTAWAEENKDAR